MSKIMVILLLVTLIGCGNKETTVIEVKEKVKIECGLEPKADKVKMLPVSPHAIKDKADIGWVGITPREYGNLAINWKTVIKVVKGKNNIITFYVECIDNFNKKGDPK